MPRGNVITGALRVKGTAPFANRRCPGIHNLAPLIVADALRRGTISGPIFQQLGLYTKIRV